MKIATFNVENIRRNIVCATRVMNESTIMCAQEHHLHDFEKSELETLFPNFSSEASAFDQVSLHDPTHRPSAGRGGVATFWLKHLDPYVQRCPNDGNERIVVIILKIPGNRPLCIINCYLPSGTERSAIELFMEDVDILHEIIHKYVVSCIILLLGDLNADHHNRNKAKERKLLELIEEHNIYELCKEVSNLNTYINPNLRHASHIDHVFLVHESNTPEKWMQAQFLPEDILVCNTSTHRPLLTAVQLETAIVTKESTTKKKKATRSYPVKKTDRNEYASCLEAELAEYNLELVRPEFSTAIMQQCMTTAIISSTPAVVKHHRSKGRREWTPELAEAETQSKAVFHAWKEAGRPPSPHPCHTKMVAAKKKVQKVTRRQDVDSMRQRLNKISDASENDQRLFHELIRLQEGTASNDCLLIDGQLIMEEEEIRQKWAEYFEKLGTPAEVDSEKSKLVEEMRQACNAEEEPVIITDELVKQAINRLNSNKAADIYGLAAEHLKFMSDSSISSLTSIISDIINDGPVPELLKKSYKINIPKKNKDSRIQDNHRGITVAPIIGKLLEVIADMLGLVKLPQNRLQFGFSHGRSPAMCSVIITEAISEARALKIALISSSEDARKAFDVVDQDRLKCKLYHTDIPKKIWRLIDDLYTGGTEQFQYKGELSSPYTILQGVKQGGIDSPPLYKFYIYNMLQQLEEEGLGLHIGALYLGSPTCADDVDLLSNDHTGSETQQMLSLTKDYSHVHKYTIHPTKSTNTILYEPKKLPLERTEWYISDVPMPLEKEFVHLGLTWMEGKTKPDLDVNLSSARRTSYRLMGKGFHGGDGLNPLIGPTWSNSMANSVIG